MIHALSLLETSCLLNDGWVSRPCAVPPVPRYASSSFKGRPKKKEPLFLFILCLSQLQFLQFQVSYSVPSISWVRYSVLIYLESDTACSQVFRVRHSVLAVTFKLFCSVRSRSHSASLTALTALTAYVRLRHSVRWRLYSNCSIPFLLCDHAACVFVFVLSGTHVRSGAQSLLYPNPDE